ncbi:MAG TPA: NYN domain-containing protein [Hyphomicrobiaceae bacterium]|nr:NYN domain-containing protein [Hyphomicrobiaceae bacterium]
MKRDTGGPFLSAVFVDYDNIYLSLKRKSEEAAKRFAKDASVWLRGIETGRLITATNASFADTKRRIVMNRCYGNPVPRRNTHDNSTDMNSFPFVRHHFLRAGFEVIDCPPLTAQLKNSSDIRMVMDVRDYLTHETYFDEFIILSGDADFTPVLHRLRAHARRTVIFANDFTAAPYTAISDGEVRESDLIAFIHGGEVTIETREKPAVLSPSARSDEIRREIMAEVAAVVRASATPVPLEALADRALRALGHEKTIGTGWAGAGTFRELLRQQLPPEIRLTAEPPYLAYDPRRHGEDARAAALEAREAASRIGAQSGGIDPASLTPAALHQALPQNSLPPTRPGSAIPPVGRTAVPTPVPPQSAPAAGSTAIQQSIARIQDACQAPPLAPHEYRLLFEVMAKEVSENDLIGAQTLANITQRAQERGLEVRRDDVRFVLEVVSEADPWFEQGASANLFAGRFRNFVVARCRSQGLNLSADELDLIDAWFAGGALPQAQPQPQGARTPPPVPSGFGATAQSPTLQPSHSLQISAGQQAPSAQSPSGLARWWSSVAEARAPTGNAPVGHARGDSDDFPRIVRTTRSRT